jgi:transposase-like protein
MTKHFMLNYRYRACQAGIKTQAVEMAINGSGIRDTARVLKINKNTIISTLKKANALVQVSSQANGTQRQQQAGSQTGSCL